MTTKPRQVRKLTRQPTEPFRLFRVEHPHPGRPEYTGDVKCPHCQRQAVIEAEVVELETGKKGFVGTVWRTEVAMLRGARTSGDIPGPVMDLVEQANAAPFDDSLEGVG